MKETLLLVKELIFQDPLMIIQDQNISYLDFAIDLEKFVINPNEIVHKKMIFYIDFF
jgi:hypothetical protein